MEANEIFKLILERNRIQQILISKTANVSETLISRYKTGDRNISKKVREELYKALLDLGVKEEEVKQWWDLNEKKSKQKI